MDKVVPVHIASSAKSNQLDVSVRIGRGGLTPPLLSEISDQLTRKRLVKIKANKGTTINRVHRNSLFSEIAKETNSIIAFQRGNVAVLWSGN